jgi:hypothetical protein
LEQNFNGKIAVYILTKYFSITHRPSGIHSRTLAYRRRTIFFGCIKQQFCSAEITQKEPLFVPKMRFYHITMKARKIAEFFAKIAEFYGRTGGQISPRPGNRANFVNGA